MHSFRDQPDREKSDRKIYNYMIASGNGSVHARGAGNRTTELDFYCSDHSAKLWTHFEGVTRT